MIYRNVLQRTYWIKCGSKFGTGFLVDLDSKRYLVTAKHVVEQYSSEKPIYWAKDNAWEELRTETTWFESDAVDLAIFSPQMSTRPTESGLDIDLDSDNLQIGQDVFFCGFPYTFFTDSLAINDGFPIGFVKKACYSGVNSKEQIYFLDGIANNGFSGAPVVAKVAGNGREKIVAVIVGFHRGKNQVIKDGEETELDVEYNSGIIRSFNIKLIVDKIRENPNGYKLEF
jgi:Trypsin-like peptidase domain